MAHAQITNALGAGRYRVKIDSGESRRIGLVNAANAALALVGAKLTASYAQVQLADTQEAAARQNIKYLIDQLAAENDPVAAGLAQKVLAIVQKQYATLVANNQPVRQQHSTLKATQADLIRQRSVWETLQTISYKDVWCTDYTVAAGGVTATIDIPGDPTLTLLAPGCRQHRRGDGNISSDLKAAAISRRTRELTSATASLAKVDASLVVARAEETTLKSQAAAAQSTYTADRSEANFSALELANSALLSKRSEIVNLTASRQLVIVTIARLNQELTYWSGRAATPTPDPGDGTFVARELTSPAQAYFNAAIFPGWQKWMPTYRWGTASNVNEAANTMDVALGPATSSAQRLNVNKASSLSNVPVQYMTCHAGAFEDGDRVVVAFAGQSFESPTVIGFLDNPRECRAWPNLVTMDLWFESVPGTSLGTKKWANVYKLTGACAGIAERLSFATQTRPIAPQATSTLRAEPPTFSDADVAAGAYDYFDLNVEDGSFGLLWSGDSSAFFFDPGDSASSACPAGGSANYFSAEATGNGYVRVAEHSCSSYSMGLLHGIGNFDTGHGVCITANEDVSGAWIHPGNVVDGIQAVPTETVYHFDAPAEEFLNAQGALPTLITATRKRGGKNPKIYAYQSVSEAEFENRLRVRWRLVYARVD